jgi:hypothetical protein
VESDLPQIMNPKDILYWFYDQGKNYNLFMFEDNDYNDEENNDSHDPVTVLKHQKYTTWLYVLLLMGKEYQSFCFLTFNFVDEWIT